MTGLCGEEAETIPTTGEDCLIGMSGARGSQRAVGCGGKKRVRCLLNVLGDFSDRIGKMFCENSDWIFFWRPLYSSPETSPDPLVQPSLRTPAGDLELSGCRVFVT